MDLAEVVTRPYVESDETSRAFGERVYAGVLGKIIGLILGRPFEAQAFVESDIDG